MAGFKAFLPPSCIVTRNGQQLEVPARELLPGDIASIPNGSKIPADIRVVEAEQFHVDNSSLTGEPEALKRASDITDQEHPLEATNIAFYGTNCVKGAMKGIVIRIGDQTVIGKIATLVQTSGEKDTPIAIEIHHFINIISYVAIFLGVTFVIAGFIKEIT